MVLQSRPNQQNNNETEREMIIILAKKVSVNWGTQRQSDPKNWGTMLSPEVLDISKWESFM